MKELGGDNGRDVYRGKPRKKSGSRHPEPAGLRINMVKLCVVTLKISVKVRIPKGGEKKRQAGLE